MKKKVYFIAGEPSGDLHGSYVVSELKKKMPDIDVYAWGGDKMADAGAKIMKHIDQLAFMGFWEVIKNLSKIQANFKQIKKELLDTKPDVVVLIDYPGFNLRLLPWLKKNNFEVLYYIAPQAWAWKENRTKMMARYIDKLMVILPFELKFFSDRGVKTEFVGHPLIEELEGVDTSTKKKQFVLLPGSRKQEIAHILPEMMKVRGDYPEYKFIVVGIPYLGIEYYQNIISSNDIEVSFEEAQNVIATSEYALVSSGTATLQTALLNTPQVVCYKSSSFNYEIGKRLIRVPYISLVNLIAEKEIVKELIQNELNPENLKQEIDKLMNPEYKKKMEENYSEVRKDLSTKKASVGVSDIIIENL